MNLHSDPSHPVNNEPSLLSSMPNQPWTSTLILHTQSIMSLNSYTPRPVNNESPLLFSTPSQWWVSTLILQTQSRVERQSQPCCPSQQSTSSHSLYIQSKIDLLLQLLHPVKNWPLTASTLSQTLTSSHTQPLRPVNRLNSLTASTPIQNLTSSHSFYT